MLEVVSEARGTPADKLHTPKLRMIKHTHLNSGQYSTKIAGLAPLVMPAGPELSTH